MQNKLALAFIITLFISLNAICFAVTYTGTQRVLRPSRLNARQYSTYMNAQQEGYLLARCHQLFYFKNVKYKLRAGIIGFCCKFILC